MLQRTKSCNSSPFVNIRLFLCLLQLLWTSLETLSLHCSTMNLHCCAPLVSLLLLVSCTTDSWQLALRPHRTSPHSALHERDLSLGSGLPPELDNSTNPLCLFLPLPDIARTFSDECAVAVARIEESDIGSEEEKQALSEACNADCMGRVIQFLSEDCQDVTLATSFLALCAESGGTPCHHVNNAYNWTSVESNCGQSMHDDVSGCSEKCLLAVSNAVEAVGCCSNYDYLLSHVVTECDLELYLELPAYCPDPFKEREDKEEEDKTEEDSSKSSSDDDKPSDSGRVGLIEESSGSIARPFIALVYILLTYSLNSFSFC